MKRLIAVMWATAVIVLLLSIITGQAWGDILYNVTDLGTLGGVGSDAYGINNKGQVVGVSGTAAGEFHAFLYSGGSMLDLGTLGGPYSGAFGINDNGHVVGDAATTQPNSRYAFVYSDGSMLNLGTLGGATSTSGAFGINSSGQIVGSSGTATGGAHAFLYTDGSMQDLGTVGGSSSRANHAARPSGAEGHWNRSANRIHRNPTRALPVVSRESREYPCELPSANGLRFGIHHCRA